MKLRNFLIIRKPLNNSLLTKDQFNLTLSLIVFRLRLNPPVLKDQHILLVYLTKHVQCLFVEKGSHNNSSFILNSKGQDISIASCFILECLKILLQNNSASNSKGSIVLTQTCNIIKRLRILDLGQRNLFMFILRELLFVLFTRRSVLLLL